MRKKLVFCTGESDKYLISTKQTHGVRHERCHCLLWQLTPLYVVEHQRIRVLGCLDSDYPSSQRTRLCDFLSKLVEFTFLRMTKGSRILLLQRDVILIHIFPSCPLCTIWDLRRFALSNNLFVIEGQCQR